jgi:hypothetical protein
VVRKVSMVSIVGMRDPRPLIDEISLQHRRFFCEGKFTKPADKVGVGQYPILQFRKASCLPPCLPD